MKKLRRTLLATLILLMLASLVGCGPRQYDYQSIWESVYGRIPAYQDELEEMVVDD